MPLLKSGFLATCLGATTLTVAAGAAAQALQYRPPVAPASSPQLGDTASAPSHSELPAGTTFQVEIERNYPMEAGERIEGRLAYPLYLNGALVVPANTIIAGTVTGLRSDSKTRRNARLHGDFTPFHIADVRFDRIMLQSGVEDLHSTGATNGAPVIRLTAPGAAPHKSLLAQQWNRVKASLHDRIAFFIAPGRGDRALQMLYHQLPYHPEHIPVHTAWTFELAAPLDLPDPPQNSDPPPLPAAAANNPEIWSVHALLTAEVTSATARPGDPVEALVVEPVYDKQGELVVPQGSTLVGKVTTAKSARSLGRNGKLRFTFQQIRFPQGAGQPAADRPVEGSLGGATTQSTQGLSMDAEGTVTPKSKASAVAPLLLTMLAGRALDDDGNYVVHATESSNGFGLAGRIVGIAAGSPNLAAGIGFYAAALSTYENFLTPGRDVDFPRDTRIEIETTPLRAPVLKPAGD